ncbi:MAG: hypothetical protein PVSMB7_15270 [Chloroflexota bacterium]
MIDERARGATGVFPGRFAQAVRFRVALLRTEVAVGSPELARVGVVTLAMALQMALLFMPGHFRPAPNPFLATVVPLGTLASLGISVFASLSVKSLCSVRVRQFLAGGALAGLAILSIIGLWEGTLGLRAMVHGTPYGNDGAVMDLYAAQQVRHGHDPYLKTNIVSALAAINAPATTTTPLMDGQFRGVRVYPSDGAVQQAFYSDLHYRSAKGVPTPAEFESKYNYPSGSFLFILPFVWAGLHDMRFLYLLALVGMGAYLWKRMLRALRPLIPFLIVGDVPLVILTTNGQPDPLYGLFLLIGFAEWPALWISPLAMGLAIGTKQLAWFFVPLYLALILTKFGWRQAARRAAIMGTVFLLLNGPFILQSPSGYVSSIAGPMTDPMFPLGIGIIALFVGNVFPLLPKIAFTVAELIAWGGATVASVRWRLLVPASAAALGALPLFFAWRSLINYFYLVPLLTLAIVLADNCRNARYREAT